MFAGLPLLLRQHLRVRGLSGRFVSETAGLLCNSAVLPGSRLATADIIGNHMGVSEKMAHSRIFTQIQLEFYVDSEYNTLKFLEHWMEFIANGSTSRVNRQSNKDYYVRMEYPHDYKCDETKIFKFDRDYNKEIEYKFIGLFPIDLTSTQVRYEQSEVLKATATFSFDRYLMGKYDSFSVSKGRHGNREPDKIGKDYLDADQVLNRQRQFEGELERTSTTEMLGTTREGLDGAGTIRENNNINLLNTQNIA